MPLWVRVHSAIAFRTRLSHAAAISHKNCRSALARDAPHRWRTNLALTPNSGSRSMSGETVALAVRPYSRIELIWPVVPIGSLAN